MTDDLRIQRAKSTGHDGFAEYLAAKSELRPTPPKRAEQTTAERVTCAATRGDERCHRAAGHTGPHEAAIPAAKRIPAVERVRAGLWETSEVAAT